MPLIDERTERRRSRLERALVTVMRRHELPQLWKQRLAPSGKSIERDRFFFDRRRLDTDMSIIKSCSLTFFDHL